MSEAKVNMTAKPPRVKEISGIFERLDRYFDDVEKASANLSDQIEPVLSPQSPQSDKAEVGQEAGTQVGRHLLELCLRAERHARHLNEMADRVEL